MVEPPNPLSCAQVPGAEWHTYDMEVQVVLEAAWAAGHQTVDISLHFPGCPYIMNFCNLTQVRKTTGFRSDI